ncbi:MAG TPA: hypothetical protein ACFYD0_03670 [Candidatus Wunengus sp. YC65]|uniref:hypothetical protein n=1 Tax=Candidatus Wunengus sp. YC65 TaxID=3367701 RepID=UPI0040258AC1
MNFKNKILSILAKKELERNKKFEDLHKGESCYIFGNGASLKYVGLEKFDDKIVIGCGALFLHKDFKKMNVKYYYEGHPLFYYPYWINPYSKKLKKNIIGIFFKKRMSCLKNISFFVSLSNYFGIQGDNIYYLHYFSKPFTSYSDSKMDGNFTPMAGALSGMLGLAIFMGFRDITLVGCDYTFFPQGGGHFYEFGKFRDLFHEQPISKDFLIDAMRRANIRVVTPHEAYRGHLLPNVNYKELTKDEPVYKENYEILSKSDLLALNCSGMLYKIFP